ncbi:hypothetical protein [Bradyrhizobium sp. CCBAU 51753]|uniref:hypothetical protein n=1 Tax=Bradyrhizobium sp. CCBAU 51753 TaxID=1325100 RepID=UPI00188A44E7|nr:hypothetical protein [Bradyrhizobium sp. CCBAU 51753]
MPVQNDWNARSKLVQEVEVADIACQYADTDTPRLEILKCVAPEEIDLLLMVGYAGATASLSARGLIANQRQATFDALPLRSSG